MMTIKTFTVLLLATVACFSNAHDAHITPLFQKNIVGLDVSQLTGQMLIVEYAPGGFSPKHRHPAHTFIYVLEGAVEMQIEGEDAVVLKAGDSFYERPEDIHLVSRNASSTDPVKFLVFAVKENDTALVIPVN
ncbi:MAG: cupin domain-containing protein [Neptuniibacter sp.]